MEDILELLLLILQSVNPRAAVELDQIYFDLTSSATLPVELTFFTAHLRNGNVILNWTTATESANYGFDIERAAISDSA